VTIDKEPFGTTADGMPVERYRLVNRDGHQVCILTYGGIVQALQAVDGRGDVADIVLGFDTLQPYLDEHPYFGAIVGRYANRIAHGRFKLDDRAYQLATNNGPHHLHGGLRGFDKQVWRASIRNVPDGACLVLRHTSFDGDEGYPGTLDVEVSYTWSDNNALRIDYIATTDAPTILNLTNHSYFNLAGGDQPTDILKHRVQLFAGRYLPVDASLIPTGELATVTGTCMDFLEPANIGENMDTAYSQIRHASGGYDHAWLLNVNNAPLALPAIPLALAAIVEEPVSKRRLQVYTTQPAIQFYTGNFLDGSLIGKNHIRYDKHAGFCLETQHYPDAPNHPQFPSTEIRPGASYQQTTIYQLSTF
jgi:aldose 1-epimerase